MVHFRFSWDCLGPEMYTGNMDGNQAMAGLNSQKTKAVRTQAWGGGISSLTPSPQMPVARPRARLKHDKCRHINSYPSKRNNLRLRKSQKCANQPLRDLEIAAQL